MQMVVVGWRSPGALLLLVVMILIRRLVLALDGNVGPYEEVQLLGLRMVEQHHKELLVVVPGVDEAEDTADLEEEHQHLVEVVEEA